MPKSARLYAISAIATGTLLAAIFAASDWTFPDRNRYTCLLLLAGVAALLKVKLPAIEGNISVNFVFILIGIATLNLTETLILGCYATLLQCIWKNKPKLIQVSFNVAVIAISIIAAFHVPRIFGQMPSDPIGMVLSGTTFFLANTALVAIVISLVENRPMRAIWSSCYLWTFPYYIVGAVIAAAVDAASIQTGWKASLILLSIMYLVFRYYQLYVSAQLKTGVAIKMETCSVSPGPSA